MKKLIEQLGEIIEGVPPANGYNKAVRKALIGLRGKLIKSAGRGKGKILLDKKASKKVSGAAPYGVEYYYEKSDMDGIRKFFEKNVSYKYGDSMRGTVKTGVKYDNGMVANINVTAEEIGKKILVRLILSGY